MRRISASSSGQPGHLQCQPLGNVVVPIQLNITAPGTVFASKTFYIPHTLTTLIFQPTTWNDCYQNCPQGWVPSIKVPSNAGKGSLAQDQNHKMENFVGYMRTEPPVFNPVLFAWIDMDKFQGNTLTAR